MCRGAKNTDVKAESHSRREGKAIEVILSEVVRAFPYRLPAIPRAQIGRWIGRLLFSQVLEADAACETFISNRRWPELEAGIGEQIRVRLEGVLALCRVGAIETLDDLTENEALRTLLVDFWHRNGIDWADVIFTDQPAETGN